MFSNFLRDEKLYCLIYHQNRKILIKFNINNQDWDYSQTGFHSRNIIG